MAVMTFSNVRVYGQGGWYAYIIRKLDSMYCKYIMRGGI